MITYVTGLPRSGKSYYIVHYIKNNHSKFDTVFTNINGFKFDRLPNTKKIKFDEFLDYAKELHRLYKEYKKNYDDYDEKLLEKLQEDGYKKSLFVIDECQEYLDRDLVHIKWLFSYHGHLGFEFIFATQALNLVHSKYKATIEGVIKAVPNSFRLSSKYLKYSHYATSRMLKDEIYQSSTLLAKSEIFDLYKSGDIVKKRSVLFYPLLGLFAAVTFFISYTYYYFTNNFKKPETQEVPTIKILTETTPDPINNIKQSKQNFNENYIYDVYCSKNKCTFLHYKDIPLDLFLFKRSELFEVIYEIKTTYGKRFYIETNEHFEQYFKNFKVELTEPGFVS